MAEVILMPRLLSSDTMTEGVIASWQCKKSGLHCEEMRLACRSGNL